MKPANAIGIVELVNIYKGLAILSDMLKGAAVEKVLARTVCPGKYVILVRGEISGVESALEIARTNAEGTLINAGIISNVDERLYPALSGATPFATDDVPGLLVVETFSIAPILTCADIAVKCADINLVRIHVAMAIGGRAFMVCTGDMESLKMALEPVLEYVSGEGSLVGYSLISQPAPEAVRELI